MDDTILDRGALDQIMEAAAGLEQPVVMELRIQEGGSELGRRLEAFAQQIAGSDLSQGKLVLRRESAGEDVPELVLRAEGRCAIRYRAVPVGPELPPFVHAITALGAPGGSAPPGGAGPVELDVFISPSCPNCPRSVAAAITVCAETPQATVQVIDATAFPDQAVAAGVRSVPMVVSETGLTLVGAMDAAELADRLNAARGSDGDAVVFGSLVDAGRFGEAAALLASPRARRAFIDRWRASALEGRIGLALTADEVLAAEPEALDDMVADLLPLLAADSAPVRGDTAELLGKIGHPAARTALGRLLDDEDEDVAEIAAEALDDLATRDRAP
jgi:alkyl hydroperoxide reductase subunit AhpF